MATKKEHSKALTKLCMVCDSRIDHWKATTTQDRKTLCNGCYNRVATELRKGSFRSDEVTHTVAWLEDRDRLIVRLMQRVRKTARREKQEVSAILERVELFERGESIRRYQKERWCLTKEEHYNIIKLSVQFLKAVDKDTIGANNGQEAVVLREEYERRLSKEPKSLVTWMELMPDVAL